MVTASELTPGEYASFYEPYLKALPQEEPLLSLMKRTGRAFEKQVSAISDKELFFAYEAGKWTLAEVLLHIIDAERVFQYRLLRFGRRDATDLPGFDENKYVPYSHANKRSAESLINEFNAVRASSIFLLETMTPTDLQFTGSANGSSMSVRALAFIICGHQIHHFRIIRERYLK